MMLLKVLCWTVICMSILICRRATGSIPLTQTGCKRFRVQRSCKDDTLLVGHTPWYERPTPLSESIVTALPWIYSCQSFSKLACNLKWTSTGTFKRQICLTIILRRTQLGLTCMDLSYVVTNFSPSPLATELYLKGVSISNGNNDEPPKPSHNKHTTQNHNARHKKAYCHTVKIFSGTVNGLCEIWGAQNGFEQMQIFWDRATSQLANSDRSFGGS